MNISEHDLFTELDAFGERKIGIVTDLAHQGDNDGIGPALLLAIGSRESNIHNIVGDAGHGRGWLQIDDRFNAAWLHAHPGVASGHWGPTNGKTALALGCVPTLTDSTTKAIEILRGNLAFAAAHGVAQDERPRFAVAAYNAGAGGALQGLRRGDVDAQTTGHDYSADVLARRGAVRRYLTNHHLTA